MELGLPMHTFETSVASRSSSNPWYVIAMGTSLLTAQKY